MSEKIEGIVKRIYAWWRRGRQAQQPHPDDETLALFVEGKLPGQEGIDVKGHILECCLCAESVAAQLALCDEPGHDVPAGLLASVGNAQIPLRPVEIVVRVKESFLEILKAAGDVIVGQELVPASVLRSRNINSFKGEVTILKDFEQVRVEVKIRAGSADACSVAVTACHTQTHKPIKDLRVTLVKDDIELESYLTESGSAMFGHVEPGRYTVTLQSFEQFRASFAIEIQNS